MLHTRSADGVYPAEPTAFVVASLQTLIRRFGTKLMNIRHAHYCMATDGEAPSHPPEDEMLPDERAVIADRLAELEDEEAHRSVDEVADALDIELDEE